MIWNAALMNAAIVRHPILSIVVGGFLLGPAIGAEAKAFKDIRHVYIEGGNVDPQYSKSWQEDVIECLKEKLVQRGFTIASSKVDAEATLIIDTAESSSTKHHGHPWVGMTVLDPDGRLLWKGESTYYQWTILVLRPDDEYGFCARANGITKRLVKAMTGK